MSHIQLPERLVLWLCDDNENHKGINRLWFGAKENRKTYYVSRIVRLVGGEEYHYLDPPIDWTLALIASHKKANPGGVIGIKSVTCCHCYGFDDTTVYRRKFTRKPYRYG